MLEEVTHSLGDEMVSSREHPAVGKGLKEDVANAISDAIKKPYSIGVVIEKVLTFGDGCLEELRSGLLHGICVAQM